MIEIRGEHTSMSSIPLEELEEMKSIHETLVNLCEAVTAHAQTLDEYKQGFKLVENAVEACQKSIKALGTVLREYNKISRDHELRLLELESKLK
jgi:hypothetical protein